LDGKVRKKFVKEELAVWNEKASLENDVLGLLAVENLSRLELFRRLD
jgi:hypothetical protein